MAHFNHIRQHNNPVLSEATWSISEPDYHGRIKLQATCQGVSLESDWVNIEDAKPTKQSMERMLCEILFTERKLTIRRKGA